MKTPSESTKRNAALIPQPVKATWLEGRWRLEPDTVIQWEGEAARQPAELLATQLRNPTGFVLPVQQAGSAAGTSSVTLTRSADGPSESEGYQLRVGESGVRIVAQTAAGLFHGTQTLRQLLPPEIFSPSKISADWEVPAVDIHDFPKYGWRGMHFDVSRHFRPVRDVLRFIDTIASLKFNRFHWHLTDDQGWRIEIKKYPKLTEVGAWRKETLIGHALRPAAEFTFDGIPHGGFYTQEEIREVVRYAADRHITVVPEIDMPGHMQAAIAAYPHLGTNDKPVEVLTYWGMSEAVLNPEDSTIDFLRDVLSEVLELFPSQWIHIGGDEVVKTEWLQSERCQQLLKERGLEHMGEMQNWMLTRIQEFLQERGRDLVGWDEILEADFDRRAVVMAWRSEDRGTIGARAGHPVVMASRNLYFDYYQIEPSENEPLAIGGCAPLDKVYSYNPVPPELTAEEAKRILGAQGQLWTEYMPTAEHLEYMAFPRACALAEMVWTPDSRKDYQEFLSRLKTQLIRLENAGVNYRRLDAANAE
ncbi:MAG: beta-N-acetylhexosaminidase [Chthoniobacterales bacterium]|nr:beta-N-acetylhexosaminidase [Chthoniobacterales bacterium]